MDGQPNKPKSDLERFEWIRANWKGKILVKGILETEDALMAKEIGADGIVVSNHGGRHIDSTTSTIAAFPKIRKAIGSDFKVFIDGETLVALIFSKPLR